MLYNRYEIQRDVRQAMYNYVNEWMKAIGKNRKFLGGDKPNLADLVSFILCYNCIYMNVTSVLI